MIKNFDVDTCEKYVFQSIDELFALASKYESEESQEDSEEEEKESEGDNEENKEKEEKEEDDKDSKNEDDENMEGDEEKQEERKKAYKKRLILRMKRYLNQATSWDCIRKMAEGGKESKIVDIMKMLFFNAYYEPTQVEESEGIESLLFSFVFFVNFFLFFK